MLKLNLMYSMPMAELFYENTAGSFLYHEDYNVLNKKSQRKQNLYWLFALGLYLVVLTLFWNHPEADVAKSTSMYTFHVQQRATQLKTKIFKLLNYLNATHNLLPACLVSHRKHHQEHKRRAQQLPRQF